MAVTWTRDPPASADLSVIVYCRWKFRQVAGLSQQDEDYEACLSDATIDDILAGHSITFDSIVYYQPLSSVAWFIRSDPEQRNESREGDAMDVWTDPFVRASNLDQEQEQINRRLIPGYIIKSFSPGPIFTRWDG